MTMTHFFPHSIAIVGGGITGLAAAYSLQETARSLGLPLRCTLIESSPSLGGKILTEHIDGFTVEGGPDSFIRQKPWATRLIQQLGIGSDLIGTDTRHSHTFVLNRGRLAPLPEGVMLIVPTRILPFATSSLISWPGKIRMGMDLFIPPRPQDGDESVGDFVRRRLGSEALEKIAEPLMSGIHVSDPDQQSLLGTFPRFREIELKHGSLIRGMLAQRKATPAASRPDAAVPTTAFLSLQGGMSQLVQSLQSALTGVDLLTGCPAVSLDRLPAGYRLDLANGSSIEADAVILATPAFVSAGLLESHLPALAQILASIRYVSTVTISLGFHRRAVSHPLNGYGFVIPRREGRRINACTWSSIKFPPRAPQDSVLLRCFGGGPGREDFVDLEDAEILDIVRSELADLMGLQAEPVLARIYRWRKANPQYDVGHLERVRQIAALSAGCPGLFLSGSAYEGVGVPDCIHQGQQAAGKVVDYLYPA